ncbi:MAG: cobyric acid synthase CobQ [Spirochaetes bacterium GWF1_41_5]|nr:MAG: cobyric acid synthase CobQ [Spirochaetes bacterium GWF1_41_5]HBE02095.1 cobyric acid synthase CobQ [Spirochaetia bacterium]
MPCLMIQGTTSSAGKTLITAGLCRIFLEDGYTVAPFKAQNMSLNSCVTQRGEEISRAQALQALACRIEPDARMNPVLLKPSNRGSHVIISGRPHSWMKIADYYRFKKKLLPIIKESWNSLTAEFNIVIAEGAGSPAEINLRPNDIVNMHVALMAKMPVIIAGDIDRGGIFAHFIGTLELLSAAERKLVKGFIINKFRGDRKLLSSGIAFLEKKTGKKVLGVMPMLDNFLISEEDSATFREKPGRPNKNTGKTVNAAVVCLPHISNFTDFDALLAENDVNFIRADNPADLKNTDIIIIPGSRNVISDLHFIHKSGFSDMIIKHAAAGKTLIGICGGFQMLGNLICDPYKIEGGGKVKGLGLLAMETTLEKQKIIRRTDCYYYKNHLPVSGYEIHHGLTKMREKTFFYSKDGSSAGCGKNESLWGTYLHGVFDSGAFRSHVLNRERRKKGLAPKPGSDTGDEEALCRLSSEMRKYINIREIYRIMGV